MGGPIIGFIQGGNVTNVQSVPVKQANGESLGMFASLFAGLAAGSTGEEEFSLHDWLAGAEQLAALLVPNMTPAQLEEAKGLVNELAAGISANAGAFHASAAAGDEVRAVSSILAELQGMLQNGQLLSDGKAASVQLNLLQQALVGSTNALKQLSQNESEPAKGAALIAQLAKRSGFTVEASSGTNSATANLEEQSQKLSTASAASIQVSQMNHLERLQAKSGFAMMGLETSDQLIQSEDQSAGKDFLQMLNNDSLKPGTSAPASGKAEATYTVQADQFADEVSRFLFKGFSITDAKGFSEAKLILRPEHLGQVDVRVSVQNGQVVATFAAETLQGKESIESQLASLRNALQNQGLQIAKIEVSHQPQFASQQFQEGRQQQASQQQARQQRNGNEASSDSIDFAVDLEGNEQELIDLLAGGQLNVTA
ncbi:flagellar hook-length control protein FliK [Paenibacillus turpanensis]|uniref:flagellar hook-length control protein FliK n=1 Tax=Paenibacillus turpanensis TaxID=2689078 RepID=UPI0014077FE9|nr:flagellar hook-length control protein FliK [Paenibacillus turpanensis]